MNNSSITLACSTFGDRIRGAYSVYQQCRQYSPEMPFIIMHQVPADIQLDQSLLRLIEEIKAAPGVQYFLLKNRGLTISRNAAFTACKTQYMWLMDDDLKFKPHFFEDLQISLETASEAICHTFESVTASGGKRAIYPDHLSPLTKKNLLRVASFEMIVDVGKLKLLDVRMREDMGVGSCGVIMGEESVLISDIFKKGGTVIHHKKDIVIHDDISTGVATNEKTVLAKGIVIKRCFSGVSRFRFFLRDVNKLLKDRDKKVGPVSKRIRLAFVLVKGVYFSQL